MNQSESIIKIVPALLKCQKTIEAVSKDSENPFFKSKYADMNSLINACKKILNDNEIIVLQPISDSFVETILLHSSGEWFSSATKIVCKSENNPQDQGSAITYARRYGLQSMLFMSAEDDDAESATEHAPVKTFTPNVPTKPTNAGLEVFCETCKGKMTERKGVTKAGKPYHGYFCTNKDHPARWI